MKKVFFSFLLLLMGARIAAQIHEPVKFDTEWKTLSEGMAEIIFTGTIDEGWHVYSTQLPEGGPVSASLTLEEMKGAEAEGGASILRYGSNNV